MTRDEFRRSLADPSPLPGLSVPFACGGPRMMSGTPLAPLRNRRRARRARGAMRTGAVSKATEPVDIIGHSEVVAALERAQRRRLVRVYAPDIETVEKLQSLLREVENGRR